MKKKVKCNCNSWAEAFTTCVFFLCGTVAIVAFFWALVHSKG